MASACGARCLTEWSAHTVTGAVILLFRLFLSCKPHRLGSYEINIFQPFCSNDTVFLIAFGREQRAGRDANHCEDNG